MLISIFDYESDDVVPLVKETLKLFADQHRPELYSVSVGNFIKILNSNYLKENKEKYPLLYKLFKKKNSDIKTINSSYNLNDFEKIISNKKDNKSVIIQSKIPLKDNWKEIIKLICYLYDLEEYDTTLYFAYASVGTTGCAAPFHSGDGGHYVCMAINVKEFYEDGTFCILDSYRRAIFDETYGDNEYYKRVYPFAEKPKQYKEFNEIFDVERISDTVIKFSLSEEYKTKLDETKSFSKVHRNERVVNYLTPLYKYVVFVLGWIDCMDHDSKKVLLGEKGVI